MATLGRPKSPRVQRPKGIMGEVRDSASAPSCRFCATPLRHVFVDLGMSPLCQRHVRPDELGQMEPFFPLVAFV